MLLFTNTIIVYLQQRNYDILFIIKFITQGYSDMERWL